jgi:enoyl-CoA hydratase/carnithine racemase
MPPYEVHAQGRVLRVVLDGVPPADWPAAPAEALQTADGVHVLVLALPAATDGSAPLHGPRDLYRRLAALPRAVVAEVRGRQTAAGLSLCAVADLVTAARDVEFSGEGAAGEVEDLWLRSLPVRVAKWLALGAGPLTAAEAHAAGFVNLLTDEASLTAATLRLAARVARVPLDVLRLKKAANDVRLARV